MDTTTQAAERIHRFEKAGLGKAPFRYLGWYKAVYQAIPGDPNCPIQPGSSCDYCGQGIMYVCRIVGTDGKEFKVGCDCVAKTGDAGLMKVVDNEKRQHERKLRRELAARKADALGALLADEGNLAKLSARPHPAQWAVAQGKTLLDWARWMVEHSGAAGKAKTLKALRLALAQ